jgi:hypothetical protein
LFKKNPLANHMNPSSTQNNHMCILCVLEFQNTKEVAPKPHRDNKTPQTKKTPITLFTFNLVLTTNNKLQVNNVLQHIFVMF